MLFLISCTDPADVCTVCGRTVPVCLPVAGVPAGMFPVPARITHQSARKARTIAGKVHMCRITGHMFAGTAPVPLHMWNKCAQVWAMFTGMCTVFANIAHRCPLRCTTITGTFIKCRRPVYRSAGMIHILLIELKVCAHMCTMCTGIVPFPVHVWLFPVVSGNIIFV